MCGLPKMFGGHWLLPLLLPYLHFDHQSYWLHHGCMLNGRLLMHLSWI